MDVLCRNIPLVKGPTNLLGLPELAERRELPEPRFSVLPRALGGELLRTGHTKCMGGAAEKAEDSSSARSATCLALLEAFRAGRGSGDPHGDGVVQLLAGLQEAILWYLRMHT